MITDVSDLTAVSRTALGVARIRAVESGRDDRLFDDPYAADLSAGYVPEPAGSTAAQALRRRLYAQVVLRTRYYDDGLLAAARPQVVVLAAGLDARAYRLDWPAGTRLWELDLPEVLAYKAARLVAEPRCDRIALGVDLRLDWSQALCDSGFRADAPTAWLVEGLLAYLNDIESRALLAAVSTLASPGSVLLCEQTPAGHRGVPGSVTDLWRGGPAGGARSALSEWAVTIAEDADLAERYGRPELAIPGGLLTARRS